MILGVTGHQDLPAETREALQGAVGQLLDTQAVTSCVSSLARGADQLVAATVLDHGGILCVVVPCSGYDELFEPADRQRFHRLLAEAKTVTTLPFPHASEEAFMAAGLVVVERCEALLAIWDGRPARGLGGTADVVGYAHQIGRRVHQLWPE